MRRHGMPKPSSFRITCLRKILHIFWPTSVDTVQPRGYEHHHCQQALGHVLWRETDSIVEVAIRWHLKAREHNANQKWHGKEQWTASCKIWSTARLARNRQGRRSFIAALSARSVMGTWGWGWGWCRKRAALVWVKGKCLAYTHTLTLLTVKG